MAEKEILRKAIESTHHSQIAFCKFITANDTGDTGAHQAGFHIHRNAWPLIFKTPGNKGSNKDASVTIRWQDDFETTSRFIYYGVGTRNEYRLTRFGRKFPFLTSEYIGSLLIITKQDVSYYNAFVLDTDDEMEEFFDAVGISISETNRIIPRATQQIAAPTLQELFDQFILGTKSDFPSSVVMSETARKFFNQLNAVNDASILKTVDDYIVNWIDTEYALFRSFESSRYTEYLSTPIGNMDRLIEVANTILQRRKSRAGKSLENHLDYVFTLHKLLFERNAVTENNKKPDFLFPSQSAYHDKDFPIEKLVVLGAKTTCKDRWRQVVREADKVEIKYLCTMQQGNTSNQLTEMYDSGIRLVVPGQYIKAYPPPHRDNILSIDMFIQKVKKKQGL